MWWIKWFYCYYLGDREQNMCSCRGSAGALVSSDQDILTSALCEDYNRNSFDNYIKYLIKILTRTQKFIAIVFFLFFSILF